MLSIQSDPLLAGLSIELSSREKRNCRDILTECSQFPYVPEEITG